jgi:toxin FitB
VKVLLDTNVISELEKSTCEPLVKAAVSDLHPNAIFLSVVTVGEITSGLHRLEPGPKKASLTKWLTSVEHEYEERILPIDVEVARIWGELTAQAAKRKSSIPASDGLIAATALRHGLHVMTRNADHFRESGALVINPWRGGWNE